MWKWRDANHFWMLCPGDGCCIIVFYFTGLVVLTYGCSLLHWLCTEGTLRKQWPCGCWLFMKQKHCENHKVIRWCVFTSWCPTSSVMSEWEQAGFLSSGLCYLVENSSIFWQHHLVCRWSCYMYMKLLSLCLQDVNNTIVNVCTCLSFLTCFRIYFWTTIDCRTPVDVNVLFCQYDFCDLVKMLGYKIGALRSVLWLLPCML